MKKYLLVFLISLTSFFLFSFFIKAAQSNNDISSIMSQGSVRSCLKRVAGGRESHPTSGKMIMTATINLEGNCLSQNGCQIWLHNSANDDIGVTNDEIKACQNGTKTHNCDGAHMQHLQNEAASQVNVKPGWHQVTDFTVLSSKKGETYIAINNNDKKVLGEATTATVPQGKVKISVSGRYAGHVSYSYYAIGDANATSDANGSGVGEGVTPEQHDTQQESTLNMTQTTTTQTGQQENCVTLYWDPFGRVFDASSLEPMSGIDVTLLDSKGTPAVINGPYNNWDTTKIDNGVYNILIDKEADYQLKVDPPSTHLFTTKISLQPNYSLIYSDIYLPGNVFHEAPMPDIIPPDFDYSKYHHDIPLMPIGSPYHVDPSDVYVINSSVQATDMGNFVSYSGKTTFPRAKICLVSELTERIIGNCVNAEKYGNFTINVDKSIVPQENIVLVANKIDLTEPIILSNNINIANINLTSEDTAKIEPILNYIEGYARGSNGQILPNATVVIKLKDGDIPVYATTADGSGFFKIYNRNLPFAEYYLEISGHKVTTSEFIKDNKTYLNDQKLDLIKSIRGGKPIIYQKNDQSKSIDLPDKHSNDKQKTGQNSQVISIQLLVTVISIVFLILAIIGLVIYIKAKSK